MVGVKLGTLRRDGSAWVRWVVVDVDGEKPGSRCDFGDAWVATAGQDATGVVNDFSDGGLFRLICYLIACRLLRLAGGVKALHYRPYLVIGPIRKCTSRLT